MKQELTTSQFIRSIRRDLFIIASLTLYVIAIFILSNCSTVKPIECQCNDTYVINYLESSMIDTVGYDKMFSVIQNPGEDLIIKDNCGELVFEFKD